MTRFLAALVTVAPVAVALGQAPAPPPAEPVAPPAAAEPAPAPPPVNPLDLPADFGWFSDPKAPAETWQDALLGGKVHLDDRLRVETVDQDGLRDSTAFTNRLRLGYETKPIQGFSALAELEWLAAFNEDNYFVPATGDGTPGRAAIADPPAIELNQLWGRYQHADSGTDVKIGRQRILLDDQRFVGNVGWRQLEQTFDAAAVKSSLGHKPLELYYALLWKINKITGPDGPNPDSLSHLIHGSYALAPELKATGFVYLLDIDDDPNSNNTYGLRGSGAHDLAKILGWESLGVEYELSAAYQTDTGDAPADYEAWFFAAEAKLVIDKAWRVGGGYQYLGSDDGVAAFQFPLGTNHKFQGYADVFLTTPASGLHDYYLVATADLPWQIKGELAAHFFRSDEGDDDLGQEIDAVLSKQISKQWSVLAKAAWYNGDTGLADRTKLWVQTEYRF